MFNDLKNLGYMGVIGIILAKLGDPSMICSAVVPLVILMVVVGYFYRTHKAPAVDVKFYHEKWWKERKKNDTTVN